MRVFLDANILFSAARTDGAIRRLLQLMRDAGHTLCVDDYVVTEARRNLERKGASSLSVLDELLRSMHVAAANPSALDIGSVDPAALERERAILTEQAAASGKPAQVIEKMVEGRLRKFYEETVLLEQVYVVDGESRVKDVVAKAAKEIGAPVRLAGFLRYALGEGIEKATSDFAAEVAAAAKG